MGNCICKKMAKKGGQLSDLFTKSDFDNGTALTPPMGWSSWNCFRGDISEKSMLEIADAMVQTGLKDAGYIYLNLDDCWMSSERDENGNLVGETCRFHRDMGITVNRINERGLKVGLYTSNGTLTCEDLPSSLGREKQDAYTFAKWGAEYFKYDFCHNIPISSIAPLIMKAEIGRDEPEPLYSVSAENMRLQGLAKLMHDDNEKIGYYVSGLDNNAGAIIIDDLTVPEDGDYYITLTFKKVGGKKARYIAVEVNGDVIGGMQAHCSNGINYVRRIQMPLPLKAGKNTLRLLNPVVTAADSAMLQYINMAYLLKWAAKKVAKENGTQEKPICFSICEWGANKPYLWGAKAGNLWRTTFDIFPKWHRIDTIYRENVKRYEYAGKGHWNDPDMLEVGNGTLTDTQNRTHFALWCMMAAPLILGNDLRKFIVNGKPDQSNPVLKIVTDKDLIAIDQDKLCKQAKPVKLGRTDILVKPIEGGHAICFYNRRKVNKTKVKFDLATLAGDAYLGFETKSEYKLFDVWAKTESKCDGIIEAEIAPMGTAVYIVK